MKKLTAFALVLICLQAMSQDTLEKKPVQIFATDRVVNANTNETVPRGKMIFKVSHNFDDIAGKNGGIKKFFGLDNSLDIRIGFHVGLSDRLTIAASRSKGGGELTKTFVTQLYELSLKYQLMRQLENDPSHPLSITLFANNVFSTMSSSYTPPKETNPLSPRFGLATDTTLNQPFTFQDFGDRMSQVLQAIIAKRIGKVGVLVNLTLVHHNYVPLHDQKTVFALGGALRIPLGQKFNLLLDYFHSFRSKSSKNYFNSTDFSFDPPNDIDKNNKAFKFYDPLGIGLEIVTAGHIFQLNFTNASHILENRYIPYTNRTWGKGQFRWTFTISRKFTLWR